MHISVTFGGCSTGLCYVGNLIIGTINNILVPVIFAIAFIVFLWGVANAYVISRGDAAKVKQGHQLIIWGLVGFFVMISIWGLVNIIANTFGISGVGAPPSPTYYPYPSGATGVTGAASVGTTGGSCGPSNGYSCPSGDSCSVAGGSGSTGTCTVVAPLDSSGSSGSSGGSTYATPGANQSPVNANY